nr:proteasome subunit beta type-1 isoform X2 [Peromyscus maniculatus bairdii]
MTRPQKPSQTASKYPPPLPDSTPPEPDAHLMSSLPPVALLTGARPGKRGGGAPQKFRGGALRQPFLAGSCPKPERCGVCGGNRWGCVLPLARSQPPPLSSVKWNLEDIQSIMGNHDAWRSGSHTASADRKPKQMNVGKTGLLELADPGCGGTSAQTSRSNDEGGLEEPGGRGGAGRGGGRKWTCPGGHFAVRQQEFGAMLSTAAHRDPDRELAMGPHGSAGPVQLRFSPYAFNGGTVLAIAGEDFSIVASDTRLSEGFSIHTRDSPKCYKLTDKTVIGCSGFHGDCLTLTKIIEARLKMYKHSNNKAMTTGAIAAMLSTILYSRRFFPYYVYNIIGGLDEEGKGAVYSFDPVGSYQRDSFKAGGSASAMLQPLLDNQASALRQMISQNAYRKFPETGQIF